MPCVHLKVGFVIFTYRTTIVKASGFDMKKIADQGLINIIEGGIFS